jgi:hypothetical protein
LRYLVTLLLLTAFLAQTFSKAFVVVEYYTNTVAFAKDCINKARPAMHCNGKCQMMKKLEQQEKKQAEDAAQKGSPKMEVMSSKAFFATLDYSITTIKQQFFNRDDNTVYDRAAVIFHPPAV